MARDPDQDREEPCAWKGSYSPELDAYHHMWLDKEEADQVFYWVVSGLQAAEIIKKLQHPEDNTNGE